MLMALWLSFCAACVISVMLTLQSLRHLELTRPRNDENPRMFRVRMTE